MGDEDLTYQDVESDYVALEDGSRGVGGEKRVARAWVLKRGIGKFLRLLMAALRAPALGIRRTQVRDGSNVLR